MFFLKYSFLNYVSHHLDLLFLSTGVRSSGYIYRTKIYFYKLLFKMGGASLDLLS